jgi:acyl dehydratase
MSGPARFEDIRVGDELPRQSWTVTKDDIAAFGDFLYPATAQNPGRRGNPHMDEEYARSSIYGGLFVDGNQTVALLCRLASDWLPPGSLVFGPGEVDIKFPNPVRVADVVTFSGTVSAKASEAGRDRVEIQVLAQTQAGKVVAAGSVTACVPRGGETNNQGV